MSSAALLRDGRYKLVAPRFTGTVLIAGGRVDLRGSSACLRRLMGMAAQAFWYYARKRGWKMEAM